MNKHQPPKLPYRFFRWYCHPDYLEDLEGDLLERFETTRKETGQRDANWQFIKDVLKLFRPGLIRPVGLSDRLINDGMYKNNFKIAYRNILKDKIFAVLNVFGLALGIAACIIIFRYVEFERS
ncbi:MAG: permease prefix domain 2-containing transporter, partial [Bacteroidota bacterium]